AFVKTPRSLALFVGAFLLACLKMGQEGLVGKITGSLVWQNQGIMRLHGTTPLYTHPNSFAGMAMGTLPFSYFLWPAVGVFPKIALLTLVVFSVNIIVFSGSRTAYVALVGLGILLLWQTKRRALFLFVGAVILAVGLMRVPQEYIDRFRSIFTLEEAEGDSSGRRLEILADAWKIFLDHPFGVGIRAFPKVRREVFGRIQDTHNLYLEILTNLGIHGFIVVALFFYKMIRTLLDLKARLSTQIGALQKSAGKGRASGETDVERHLSDLRLLLAVSNAVLMYVAIRLILGFFGMDLYEIYWWLACGTTISIFNMNRVAERKTAACLEAGRKAKENG
ncbi:MAG: O-antigen ligase family protein, partial [Deltaproteobacteria bacterium]|nr:O-antigen ligase family protein [Deltaproteobacteria bacterium]